MVALAFPAAPDPASAQSAPEPGAIERTIPQVQQRALEPVFSAPAPDARNQEVDHRRFTLGAVNIDGATIFSQEQLSQYFEPYLATEVDQGKLVEMAAAITAQYRRTGYLLSYAMVPAQHVDAGMVRLAVVEGQIGGVTVQGAGSATSAIEAIAASLVHGGPLNESTLERTIGLIRDFPGLKLADVALVRSDVEAGIYALKIKVVRDRTRGFTYFDNRGTASIGRNRFYDSLSVSSLAVAGDELRIDLFAMPGSHSRYLFGQALAAVPIGAHGMRLSLTASRGNQYLRAQERFDGRSDNVTAQLTYPLRRSRALSILGKASLTDWRSTGRQAQVRQLRDRLRVARLGLEFSSEGTTQFDGEIMVSRGLGFGGMTRVGDPLASRPDASGKFTKVALSLQVTRPLGDRVTVRTVAVAQYSERPLLSAEEFSLGGNRVGRAFEFNALTGERGIGGGVEMSYRLGQQKANRPTVELFGFADGGIATDIKSPAVAASSRSLASAGIGTRFTLGGTSLSVEAAMPLSGNRHSPRVFLSAFHAF